MNERSIMRLRHHIATALTTIFGLAIAGVLFLVITIGQATKAISRRP
jgi:hypothetical protein